MILNSVIFGLICVLLYAIFSRKDSIEITRVDDRVIECIGGRFMLVDKRR